VSAFKEQIVSDLSTTFINVDELGKIVQVRVSDGMGGFTVSNIPVVWDNEMAKRHPLVSIHGMYLGDVIVFIEHKYLPRMPLAGEIIYIPANNPWEVLDCTDEESCYKLALSAYRSQPGRYGNN
jgi:hypothetical protein